jgi:DNA polymerase-3 subunit delta'
MSRLEARRLPGGVLLHGPRGIGKATLAFDFARAIFRATGDEAPEHVAQQVASGGYPNLFVLRKSQRDTGKGYYTQIRVDEVRALIDAMQMTRGRAGHRVAIVDSIDDCNPSSANALLKILEEPPADTTFLLVSHRPGSLLPTIRSRTIPLALRPLAGAEVEAVLATARPEADLAEAVPLAGGRPRRGFEALLLPEQAALGGLRAWLADPLAPRPAAHLALADALGADRDGAELRFARDMIDDWLAAEARDAAVAGQGRRLASATELWDKAQLLLADADEYNLDMRQTLAQIFDAIRRHRQLSAVPSEP